MNATRRRTASPPETLILAGPTGVGKTQVAVELARRRACELVSADSMQVYRGLEIGTAQPTAEELRGVRLHGCGVLEPTEPFNARLFVELCESAHHEILERGAVPLYVGGTGMYLRALRWGLLEHPPLDGAIRARLEGELRARGAACLHGRLAALDPRLAEAIGESDEVRIVRALELAEASGEPPSRLRTQWENPVARFAHRLIVLTCPRAVLIERIERRVEAMLEAGWVEEVRKLLTLGLKRDRHCFKALGYRPIIDMLGGTLTEKEMREEIKAKTRQFGRRQMTWFRKEIAAEWVQYGGREPEEALAAIEKTLELPRALG